MNFRKTYFVLIFICFQFLNTHSLTAQDNDFSSKYPHVTADLAENSDLFLAVRHTISMPGIWGLGGYAAYDLPFNLHASMDLGYGWVISKHENDFDKTFRGWLDARAGYTLFKFTSKKSGKFVTAQTNDREFFYNIQVPSHHKIIVEAGYLSMPTTIRATPDGTGSGKSQQYSFAANNFTIGIKWSAYSKSNVRVIDSSSGETHTGETQRLFEFEAGMIFPIKDEIDVPDGYKPFLKSEKQGYYFVFRIPYKLNSFATFDFGVRSLGYNDNAQFYLGNTIYL